MKCRTCNEEYDVDLFPLCPFCLSENLVEEARDIREDAMQLPEIMESENEMVPAPIILENIMMENQNKEHDHMVGNGDSNEDDMNDISSQKMDKIEDIFAERRYAIFRRYCENKGYVFMEELCDFNFSELEKVSGVGKGKQELIVLRYEEYENGKYRVLNSDKSNETTINPIMFETMHADFFDRPIDFLKVYEIKQGAIEKFKKNAIEKLGDLKGRNKVQLSNFVGPINLSKLEKIEEKLELDIRDNLEFFLEESIGTDEYNMILKKASGYTLQEIADQKERTRERIRQIIKKYCNKLTPFMECIIAELKCNQNYFTSTNILDLYDNDDFDKVLLYWCKMNDKFDFLSCADVFIEKAADGVKKEESIWKIAKEFIGEGIDFYEHLEEVEILMQSHGYPYVDIDAFITLVEDNGCRFYGDYLAPKSLSYGMLCARVIAKQYPNGIKLYTGDDLDELRKKIEIEYGTLETSEDDRSFSSRVSAYLVLRGRGEFIAPENVYIENSLLEEIRNYIDSASEKNVYYGEIFKKFEGALNFMSNIDNYNFLHGVLALYYPDDYQYTRDYLIKANSEMGHMSVSDRIRKIIIDAGVAVSRNEIKSKCAGFSDVMIASSIYNDSKLFLWEYNYYSTLEIMDLTEEDKTNLIVEIRKLLEEHSGIISDGLLYESMQRNMSYILIKNNIKSSMNLYYLCAKLFEKLFAFKRPHIAQKEILEELSMTGVAMYFLKNPKNLSYQTFQELCKKMKWSDTTASMMFREIERDYIRVSADQYVHKDVFYFDRMMQEKIDDIIENHMEDDILVVSRFQDWNELPKISYRWNPFILRQVIERFSTRFKIIEQKSKDRRLEKGIIISESSTICNYVDIVATYLLKINKEIVSEGDMLSILLLKGLTRQVIPKEIYTSRRIKFRNDYFEIVH